VGSIPEIRIRKCNEQAIRESGEYVLYWMIANRRLHHNFSLDRALEYCESLHKPLLVFEPLRVGYQWASDRIHRFVVEGMAENARICEKNRVRYFAYVEPASDADKGLLQALAEKTCVVITDDFPCFFLPRMIASAGRKLPVRLEAVDSNGLMPMRATEQVAQRAFDFRRYLQKELPKHIREFPKANPFVKAQFPTLAEVPKAIAKKWPPVSRELLAGDAEAFAALPIDHSVGPGYLQGGSASARAHLMDFIKNKLSRYAEDRNDPDLDGGSGFSPFLHFGYLSPHEIFLEVARREKWKPEKLSLRANGSREGWWNMSPGAEGLLDELITWRELGYNLASHRTDYDQYESLPEWAKNTLREHAKDEREHIYSLQEFEDGKTHDALWNAAQIQLVQEGRIHNYLRMLWGKKILEWSRTPQEAAEIMIHLNNKYGLDGRNPNSYSGIFWVLGRYDRPWGPIRPIYGTIRYMSSENTARKVSVKSYMKKYATESQTGQRRLSL
jgi:deoxyribodipyrimidine photo-lyase